MKTKQNIKKICSGCNEPAITIKTLKTTEILLVDNEFVLGNSVAVGPVLPCCKSCFKCSAFKFESAVEEMRKINRESRETKIT